MFDLFISFCLCWDGIESTAPALPKLGLLRFLTKLCIVNFTTGEVMLNLLSEAFILKIFSNAAFS